MAALNTSVTDDELYDLYQRRGLSFPAVERETGLAKSSVHRRVTAHARRHGLPCRAARFGGQGGGRYDRLQEGWSITRIARADGVTTWAVVASIERYAKARDLPVPPAATRLPGRLALPDLRSGRAAGSVPVGTCLRHVPTGTLYRRVDMPAVHRERMLRVGYTAQEAGRYARFPWLLDLRTGRTGWTVYAGFVPAPDPAASSPA